MTTCEFCDRPESRHGSGIDSHRFTPRPECPCCAGRTDFNWVTDTCDDCAEQILAGEWGAGHPHGLSDEQREALR